MVTDKVSVKFIIKKNPQQGDLGSYLDRVSPWTNSNQVPLNPVLN